MGYGKSRANTWQILLALFVVLALIGLSIAVFVLDKKLKEERARPPAYITQPGGHTDVILSHPDDHGAVDMDEANYGPVLTTKPFPAGFVPGPTASPCIVARYLLDLPGMPSFIPQERLPWTYEERLVLEAFQELCNDGDMVKTVRLEGGFGFFAYIIDKNSVPYNRYFVMFYLPKLGWQLGRCIPPNNLLNPTAEESCINFIGRVEEKKKPGRPIITSVIGAPNDSVNPGTVTIFFEATGDNVGEITNFVVSSNPSVNRTVNGPSSPIIFDGLVCSPSTLYEFRVTAENANGASVPSEASQLVAPACPTTLAPTTIPP